MSNREKSSSNANRVCRVTDLRFLALLEFGERSIHLLPLYGVVRVHRGFAQEQHQGPHERREDPQALRDEMRAVRNVDQVQHEKQQQPAQGSVQDQRTSDATLARQLRLLARL